jgi:uncharacterized Zn finger protein
MDRKIFDANAILNKKILDQEIEDIQSDATFSLTDPKDSFEALQRLQAGIGGVQQKIKDGLAQTHDHEIAANRLALLQLTGDVMDYVNNELTPNQKQIQPTTTGDNTASTGTNIISPEFQPHVKNTGYGATGGEPNQSIAASVETDSSKLITEVLPAVVGAVAAGSLIKRALRPDEASPEEDISSGMNHSAVEPDDEDGELILQAYHEMVKSLQDRIEDTWEDSREIDVQTSESTPAIKLEVKGYVKSPMLNAAKRQEKATKYEGYMTHSTANPQKWG